MFASSSDVNQSNGIVNSNEVARSKKSTDDNGGTSSEAISKKGKTVHTQTSAGRSNEKWLLANHDPHANIFTISSGITLADLYQDGDYRLLIGDIGFTGTPKLRVRLK